MEYKIEKKSAPGRDKVEVLGATYEEGKPEGEELGKWRQKLRDRKRVSVHAIFLIDVIYELHQRIESGLCCSVSCCPVFNSIPPGLGSTQTG